MSGAFDGVDLDFWRALARHSNLRLVALVPALRTPLVAWVGEQGPAEEIAELAALGRAWLGSAAAAEIAGGEHVATAPVRSADGGAVVAALVAAKAAGSAWSTSELAMLEFVAGFYAGPLAQVARRPRPAQHQLPPGDPSRLARWMRTAPERGELALRYQPEIDLRTGDIVAVEALVRWEHPDRGLLGPESFLALAEQSDLINVLGNWVIATSLADFAGWLHDAPADLVLRVNVSPAQLTDAATVALLSRTLRDTGVRPQQVCVEITETPAPDEAQLAQNVRALAALGVHAALDDLGTGSSTLARLHALAIDTIKIDRSLISGLDSDDRRQAIVAAFVSLGEQLELDVVAEGVETGGEVTALCEASCFRAQGHLFGRPMTGEQMRELLRIGTVPMPQ